MDHQFSPNEPASGNSAPMSEDAKKTARRHFSQLGLMFFFGTLIFYAVQSIAALTVNAVNPGLLSNINYSLLIGMIPTYVISMPLMMFLIHKFVPAKQIEKKKMPVGQWLIAFIICVAGMYISNFIGIFITQIISVFKGSPVTNEMLDLSTSTSLWINIIIMVLLAPIYEEMIFRKLLIDRVVKYGEGTAILFSGLMFGLFHGNLNQFAYAFILGVIFGFVYVKTGTIRYTILLHMIINFMGSVLGVLVLKLIDYNALMEASNDPEIMTAYMMSHLPQFMVYMIYCFVLLGLVIAGIVLFIVKIKQIRLEAGEVRIPKGQRFSSTVLNVGMILYFIFWIIVIIYQLMQ